MVPTVSACNHKLLMYASWEESLSSHALILHIESG